MGNEPVIERDRFEVCKRHETLDGGGRKSLTVLHRNLGQRRHAGEVFQASGGDGPAVSRSRICPVRRSLNVAMPVSVTNGGRPELPMST